MTSWCRWVERTKDVYMLVLAMCAQSADARSELYFELGAEGWCSWEDVSQ